MPRLTDPDFVFPSGKTLAEMEAFHRQWELDHGEPAASPPRASAPVGLLVACINCGEEMAAFVLDVHRALRH